MRELKKLTRMRNLNVSQNESLSNASFIPMSRMSLLTSLNIAGTNFSSDGARHLTIFTDLTSLLQWLPNQSHSHPVAPGAVRVSSSPSDAAAGHAAHALPHSRTECLTSNSTLFSSLARGIAASANQR
eukprot:765386-Hanusia_phi.AAC.9